MMTSTLFIA